MIIAHEKGLTDKITTEQVVVSAAKPNANVMACNPLNKIPTLMLSDGTVLYDTRVICEYFDVLGDGEKLCPTSGAARWFTLCRQAQGIGLLDLLVGWLRERSKAVDAQDPELNSALSLKLHCMLDKWEETAEHISGLPFDFSHAAIGAALGYADFRFGDENWREGHPNLAALYQAISARASFRATEHKDAY